jgi:drug/metabolite transporter (DMT)-like permease
MVRSTMMRTVVRALIAIREIGDNIYLLSHILVHPSVVYKGQTLTIVRYWKKIPDPLLGPKGVRTLLVFRGLTGCEFLQQYVPHTLSRCRRFLGLSGIYFSLQYLSLSDAMVLTFLVPILAGFSGAVFLKEPNSLKEVLAGCRCPTTCSPRFQFTIG